MAATSDTVVGVFAHVDTTVRALEELRSKGYHDLAVYTPLPVHEIEEVQEPGRRPGGSVSSRSSAVSPGRRPGSC